MSQKIEDLIQKVSDDVKRDSHAKTVTFQQILATSAKEKDVEEWGVKDFLHYYIDLYERATKQKYLVTYSTDLASLKALRSIFVKHTMSTDKKDFRDFLDWCYENRAFIIKDAGCFLLTSFRKYVNRYVADSQESEIHTPKEENFIEKIRAKSKKTSKFVDMLKIYGIPVMVTYMVSVANKDEQFVINSVDKIIRSQHESKNITALRRIAKQSIALSPYPEFFNGLDWRQELLDIWEDVGIMDEDWWRPVDYPGEPAEHYQELKDVEK